nr:hypothetical protein [uncultured Rhodopila sp.]
MTDPVRQQWSEEELREAAMEFMRVDFGLPPRDDQEARARWYERLGLIVSFTSWLWTTNSHTELRANGIPCDAWDSRCTQYAGMLRKASFLMQTASAHDKDMQAFIADVERLCGNSYQTHREVNE